MVRKGDVFGRFFEEVGKYVLFLKTVCTPPRRRRIVFRQFLQEADKLIISSSLLVGVISIFIGGVLAIQTAANLENPFIDKMYVGYMVRESLVLEFSSTMVALILAGKMGSNISSEIGSMRITEQIDAMDMMGVNSANFLVFPKIAAATVLSPLLMLMGFALGLIGGGLTVYTTGIIPFPKYIVGIKYCFSGYYVFYSCVKIAVFCFIISSISAYRGYYAQGGSLGVGKASTRAIVTVSILILLMDLVLTNLMMY